jgi:hypothetical protein
MEVESAQLFKQQKKTVLERCDGMQLPTALPKALLELNALEQRREAILEPTRQRFAKQ